MPNAPDIRTSVAALEKWRDDLATSRERNGPLVSREMEDHIDNVLAFINEKLAPTDESMAEKA